MQVPIWAIHHNPDFYPEPERFDPERFLGADGSGGSGGSSSTTSDFTYLAFGGGPRLCIGMRWGCVSGQFGTSCVELV